MTEEPSLADLLDDQRAEQRRCWLGGDPVAVEAIFERHPRLLDDVESTLELVYGEVLLREERGESPQYEEYARRFPAFADRLSPLFEVHRALESDRLLNTTAADSFAGRELVEDRTRPTGPPPDVPGYEILGELGRGGMGVVYRARQASLNRQVALKMILAGRHASSVQVARFRAEARAIAQLQHPNIVQIHDVGEHDGQPFLSLELVEGASLAQNLGGVPQTAARAARWVHVLAHAIQTAHGKGIIHRDLKPSNILLASDGTLKITDFGLAKSLAVDPDLTHSGSILGSPSYMAPEQAMGPARKPEPAVDVYALGAILYELLTGRAPFRANSVLETLELVRWAEPVAPRQLQPKLPRDLETICLKCLRKEPARRYASAEALAQDLARWLAGEPIAARPVTPLERLCRWSRRNKAVAGLLTAVATILVAATVAATLAAVRLDRLARDERRAARQAALARHDAESRAALIRQMLVRQYATTGTRLVDDGNLLASLPWFVEALRLDGDDPGRAEDHRIRIDAVLRACPKLVDLLPHDRVFFADYDAAGRRILTAGFDGAARLWSAADGTLEATLMHQGELRAASFSRDDQLVVTAGTDGTARVWDADTGSARRPPLRHPGVVTLAAFHPDGRSLATGCEDGIARLWDLETGRILGRLSPHEGALRQVVYSPDGRLIATSDDRAIRLWEASTGAPRGRLNVGRPVWRTIFSPDGRSLVAASLAHKTAVWDVAGGKLVLNLGHDASVWHAAYSPDGRRIATACFDGKARVWDADTGVPTTPPLPHGAIALHVAYSPDGRRIVTASDDQTARVWDAATGALRATLGHGGPVQRVVFSRNGRRVLTASDDGMARVWDLSDEVVPTILTHRSAVHDASFRPDGRQVVTASADRTARVWDADTGAARARLDHKAAVWHAAYSPDGRRIVTASADRTARIWDADTGGAVAELRHAGMVWHAAYSPDGRLIVTASGDAPMHDLAVTDRVLETMRNPAYHGTGEARVWDAGTGAPLTPPLAHAAIVPHAAFSPDGRHVVTSCGDGSARVWDVAAAALVATLTHSEAVLHAEYSPDGRLIVTAGYDNLARTWDAATGRPLTSLPHGRALPYATFDRASRRILTASDDGKARVWDAATGAPLTLPMAHNLPLFGAAFSPDSRHVVTAGDDDSARVWDASTGIPLTPRLEHSKKVNAASFSPDGRHVVTSCNDGTARIWELAPGFRSLDDLTLIARVLSGHEIHIAGGLMAIGSARLLSDWRALPPSSPRPGRRSDAPHPPED